MYIPVRVKFTIAISCGLAWFVFTLWLALPWIRDLSVFVGTFFAFILILLIALIPGFMNMFILVAYLLDERPKPDLIENWPDVSIMIAALNEEKNIEQTVMSVAKQKYPGNIEIIVIDNGSKDRTYEILKNLNLSNLIVLREYKRGKSHALNHGITVARNDYIITLDADTYLLQNAVKEIVIRLLSVPDITAAVAGSIYVRNSRESLITRLQEWDYFHAIATIKRVQSLLQGTLVAQGAFSIYKKKCVQEVGCWPDTVGEDIVLTWGLLAKGYRIDFAEKAIAFTMVPATYKLFLKQRNRWARGMFEAFSAYPKVLIMPKLSTFFIYWDLLFPAVDSACFFILIPGIIVAFFGYHFIAGPMTLAVLPISFLTNLIFYFGQKEMFAEQDLKVRRNFLGFLIFVIIYYPIMLPAIMYGYMSELLYFTKSWGTK